MAGRRKKKTSKGAVPAAKRPRIRSAGRRKPRLFSKKRLNKLHEEWSAAEYGEYVSHTDLGIILLQEYGLYRSHSTISKWFRLDEPSRPDFDLLANLAELYGVELEAFLER